MFNRWKIIPYKYFGGLNVIDQFQSTHANMNLNLIIYQHIDFCLVNTKVKPKVVALFLPISINAQRPSIPKAETSISNITELPVKLLNQVSTIPDKYNSSITYKTWKTLEKVSKWGNKNIIPMNSQLFRPGLHNCYKAT